MKSLNFFRIQEKIPLSTTEAFQANLSCLEKILKNKHDINYLLLFIYFFKKKYSVLI